MNDAANAYDPPALAIAIVGLAGRFPGAESPAELWDNLVHGVESIRQFSDAELAAMGVDPALIQTPGYVPAAGVLSNSKAFDAAFFGYAPREVELMDPQQRVFLECAWSALEDAGLPPAQAPGVVGVFAGSGPSSYLLFNLASHPELLDPANQLSLMTGNDKGGLATRVAYKLNLKGPALTVQTACSTSLVAVQLACQHLLGRQCDLAIAGGATVLMPERTGYVFHPGEIASPDGHCRPFDHRALGTVFSSGAGAVALQRLEDALADGNHIYAVIRGAAVNNDGGHKIGFTAPSIEGQAEVIATAHAIADVAPETISYVEAHGTGTAVGDPTEIQGLCRAFGDAPARESCAIGSLKSNLGHLDSAAGVAGLIKTALALHHGVLPPSLHFERANPQIAFEHTPFFVNATARAWPRSAAPRRAGVSSFGIGGTNAHAVLEEAPLRTASPSRSLELLPISARTPTALAQVAARLAAQLDADDRLALADVAHTLQHGRRAFPCRATVVCGDRASASAQLRALVPAPRAAAVDGAVFLFPGQGSQYPGMATALLDDDTAPVFRGSLAECARLLAPTIGRDLRDLLRARDAERLLNQTEITQPALFAIEYALAQQWRAWGVRPAAMIGHSVGEYVAACQAGVFSLADALQLIAARGRLMATTPPGGMLAVGAPEAQVAGWLGDGLELAAVNAPSQCVVAGGVEAIEALHARLTAARVVARVLPTARAFHSRHMDPILAAFERTVSRIALAAPTVRVASNLTGGWLSAAEATSPRYWVDHLRGTVRFADNVRGLRASGTPVYLEVGPGRTLGGLVRASLESPAEGAVVASLPARGDRREPEELLGALGQVWAAGLAVDWAAARGGSPARRVPLPTYPFERQDYWIAPAARTAAAPRGRVAAGTTPPPRAGAGPATPELRYQRPALAVAYAAPSDELERQLAGFCEELLGIAGIGVHDNFFELGGDSLVAVRLVSRLRDELELELDVRALFDHPTIARLARALGDQRAATAGGDVASHVDLIAELSEDQAEALVARWSDPRPPAGAAPGVAPPSGVRR